MGTLYRGGVDQKRGSRGQNIPNWTCFFAKCTCLSGFEKRLFFSASFSLFLWVRETFFRWVLRFAEIVECSLKLWNMRGPGGICNESSTLYIEYRYSSHSFLSFALLRRSGAQWVWLLQNMRFCNGAQRAGPRGWEKNGFWRDKTHENTANFFCGFGIHIKNTFCKNIGPKQSI